MRSIIVHAFNPNTTAFNTTAERIDAPKQDKSSLYFIFARM